MVKRCLASGLTGYYLAVDAEGNIGAGDRVETIARHPARIPVAEITRVHASNRDDLATTERLVALDALPEDWRSCFEKKSAERASRAKRASTGRKLSIHD
jgi:MOSC domain-containing protein YiiM